MTRKRKPAHLDRRTKAYRAAVAEQVYRTSWPFSESQPRPDCRRGDGRPVYLAGVCSECYAAGLDKEGA